MPITAEEQVTVGSTATVSATFHDQNGEPLVSISGTVTVGVERSDGSTIIAAGGATTGSGGSRSVALPAGATDRPDVLVATWTNGTATVVTLIEVVAGFYASVAQIRASDPVLADDEKFTDADLRAVRHLVETEFERITGRAFVPRFARYRMPVSGNAIVLRDYEVDEPSVSVSTLDAEGVGTTYTGDSVVLGRSGVVRLSGRICSTCAVSYVHGFHRPPADVLGAFYLRCVDVLSRPFKGQDSRTETFTNADNGGTFTLIVPGMKGSQTGIPDVDVVLAGYTVNEAKLR